MKETLKFIKPYIGRLCVGFIFMGLMTVTSLILPYVMSEIVDGGIKGEDMTAIYTYGGIMLGAAVLGMVFSLIANRINSKVGTFVTGDLRRAVFRKVNALSLTEFNKKGTAEFLTRSTDDTYILQEVVTSMGSVFVQMPILFIGGVALTFSRNVWLSLIIFTVVPIAVLMVFKIGKNVGPMYKKSNDYIDVQNRIVRERLGGIRVIRAFNSEDHEHERLKYATEEMSNYIIRANVLAGLINPVSVFLFNLATVVIMFVGAQAVGYGSAFSAGDLIAVVQYVTLIANAIMIVTFVLVFLPRAKVCMGRIGEVFALADEDNSGVDGEVLSGEIELKDVSFSYTEHAMPAVSGLNMSIAEGETVAIIGGTGSGKTTVLRLLLGFYAPTSGSISMGGKNYSELAPKCIRQNVSVALQKATVFMGTIAENVRMGKADATDEEIMEALTVAQIDGFVKSEGVGLSYELNQGGANLSGGQKQRLNIARAIVKPASVYMFDDSFSALDFLTEANLRRALNRRLAGKTQVIITQRAATAMRCDKIYVLDEGKQVGEGAHEQLMKSCDVYREIYRSQMGEEVSANG